MLSNEKCPFTGGRHKANKSACQSRNKKLINENSKKFKDNQTNSNRLVILRDAIRININISDINSLHETYEDISRDTFSNFLERPKRTLKFIRRLLGGHAICENISYIENKYNMPKYINYYAGPDNYEIEILLSYLKEDTPLYKELQKGLYKPL